MSNIRQAQIEAGENAVIEDLRAKGLLPPAEPIALDEASAIIAEMCESRDEWSLSREGNERYDAAWEAARAWLAKQKGS